MLVFLQMVISMLNVAFVNSNVIVENRLWISLCCNINADGLLVM